MAQNDISQNNDLQNTRFWKRTQEFTKHFINNKSSRTTRGHVTKHNHIFISFEANIEAEVSH